MSVQSMRFLMCFAINQFPRMRPFQRLPRDATVSIPHAFAHRAAGRVYRRHLFLDGCESGANFHKCARRSIPQPLN